MALKSKLSNILLAAALGATSTAYAGDNENKQVDITSGTNVSAKTGSNSITYFNASQNINYQRPTLKVLSQGPLIFKDGFFTATQASSRIIEVEETEYVEKDKTKQEPVAPDSSSVQAISGTYRKSVINTYQEVELCERTLFLVRCESHRTKIEGQSRDVARDVGSPAP